MLNFWLLSAQKEQWLDAVVAGCQNWAEQGSQADEKQAWFYGWYVALSDSSVLQTKEQWYQRDQRSQFESRDVSFKGILTS